MEICDYKKGDELEILKLFKIAFGKEMSLDYWRWRFEMNPAGKHLIKLMWDGGKLVGHYAVSPVKAVFGKRELTTALSMTTMTHPDYGGKGVFGLLAKALYQEISISYKINFVWGFPNINSHYSFVNKLSWSDIGVLHDLSISRKQIENFGFKRVDKAAFLSDTSHIEDRILKNHDDHSSFFKVVKDKEYLKWRIDDNPTQTYKIVALESEENRQELVLIFKKYNTEKGAIINIVDLFGKVNPESLKKLLAFAFDHYSEATHATMWMSLWSKDYAVLEKLRFKPAGNITYLGCRAEDNEMGQLENLKTWDLSFLDSDVF